jgi:DNA polymerase-3 subunit delta'
MKFSNVIGQKVLKQQLIQTVKENRVSHAQLFAGNEGTGGMALALAYAQYICCENTTDNDSCGVCRSCLKYEKLVHPDLHFVFPVVNTGSIKAVSDDFITEWRSALLENAYLNLNHWIEIIAKENKQGGIFEKESGEIIRKLSLKTYESEYKIMIIWMPEKMHTVASNKLLKLIEEPPQKTLFILVSENPGQLLATILSRCQLIKVPPIDRIEMSEAIVLQIPESSKANEITRVANGNYLKALELINSEDDDQFYFNYFVSLMRNCYSKKVLELIKWAEEVASIGREKQKKFLLTSLRLVRENFTMNVASRDIVYLNNNESQFSDKFHPYINEENIQLISEQLNKAIYHIEANGNAKIIFLDLALKLVKLIRIAEAVVKQ